VQVFPQSFDRWYLNLQHPTQAIPTARIVLVGGLDPGTGAGVARDLLTTTALSARGVVVGTAWTEQGAQAACTIEPRAPERVRAALASALERVGASGSAVKIGMVASAATTQAIEAALLSYPGPVVYDPVLRTSRGYSLYDGDRSTILALARRATLLTPNLGEAAWLLDRPVRSESDARRAARDLRALGVAAVLVKGGHLEGDATDVLLSPAGESVFSSPRIAGPSPRGTGCALATAIAVGLARGEPVENAVAAAKTWLARQIAGARPVGDERHL
jgi:hydroxymethylpyrimidine/phosphomethylpyrimidine kinase